MTEIDLKKKYLKRAHHLIIRDDRTLNKRKLQVSVEPVRAKHSTEKWRSVGEWNDSHSDSDSLFRQSSSSQLAQFDHHPSPPLELRQSLPSNSIRPSPTVQHKHLRTSLMSLSMPTPRHSHKLSASNPCQKTTDDIAELETQLRMQTDINRELKRLLVASVGSDLELRLQQIVLEKAELSQDLNVSLEQVLSHHEELDQVSIECDIWRSKFIASRVMIDELASWKAELSLQLRESRKALQHVMLERGELCRELQECNAHLQKTLSELERRTQSLNPYHAVSNSTKVATVSPVQYYSAGTKVGEKATVLDLAHSNTIAARKLTPQLCRVTSGNEMGSRSIPMGIIPPCVVEPTTGEKLAQRAMDYREDCKRAREASPLPKLLLTDEDLIHHRSSAASVGSSLPPLSRRLFHFGAKALEDPFRLPFHCTKCRGKIIIV